MAKVRKREWSNAKGEKKLAYVVDYTDAEGVRRTPQFEKKHQADAHLRKVQREIEDGVHVSKTTAITFSELADLFLRDCERRKRIKDKMSGATYQNLSWVINQHLRPAFGTLKVPDINAKHLRDIVNEKAEKYSRVTVVKIIYNMRLILQFGLREGHLKRNVARDDPPRIPLPPTERIEIPSLDTLKRLVSAVELNVSGSGERLPHAYRGRASIGPIMSAVAIYAALTAGLRKGEICGLQWQAVDFEADTIRVEHSISRLDGLKGPKSRAGLRTIPMHALLRRRLMDLHCAVGFPTQGFVLPTRAGTPFDPDNLTTFLWDPVARAADVRRKDGTLMGMHALRHAAASLWIRAGVPDLALKAAIGHSSIAFTKDVYGHLFEADGEAVRRLQGASMPLLTLEVAPST